MKTKDYQDNIAKRLASLCMFSPDEIEQIVPCLGTVEMKYVPAACELLGIKLTKQDIAEILRA